MQVFGKSLWNRFIGFAKRRNITKVSLLLILVMFLCLSDYVYAAEEELSGTITVMMHESEATMKPYHEAFMRKYPNVTVEYVCLDDYENAIRKKIIENDFGDVVFVPGLDIDTLQKRFEPLGLFAALNEKYNYVDRGGRVGDLVYSLPSSAYLSGFIYNKDLFYKAGISDTPKSIKEFYEDMCLIKEVTDAIPFCSYYSTDWTLYSWVYFPYIEMTGDSDFRQGDFLHRKNPFSQSGTHYQVFKLLSDMISNGLTEQPIGSINWNESMEMLRDGKLGCVALGSWGIHQLIQMGMNPDSIGFMPFPNEVDGKQYMTVLTDYCIGINRSSENKEVAHAYVDFLLGESGYATQQDRISVLKSDIYPESYSGLEDVICIVQGTYSGQDYDLSLKLKEGIDPEAVGNLKRIMEAAAGFSGESFDEIMREWNTRWENARPEDLEQETNPDNENKNIIQIDVTQNDQMDFSEVEKDYIRNHPVIRVGYLKEKAPFQYMDSNGQFQGLSYDLLQILLEQTGLTAEYYPYQNTQELIYALNGNEIDIAAGVENVKENSSRVKFSKEYISYSDVIVNLKSIDKNALQMNQQAIVLGENNVKDYGDVAEYLETSDVLAAIQMVEKREADFTITNCYTAEYYLYMLNNNKLATIPISSERKLCLAFAKKADFQLVSICNKCIYSLSDSTLQMQLLRYMEKKNDITIKTVIMEYPIQTIIFLLLLFLFVICSIGVFYREKRRHIEKHTMDMKRYEIISGLMDEYIFDYDVTDGSIHLERKFQSICGFYGNQTIADYQHNNILLNIILEHCEKVTEDHFVSEPFRYTNLNDQTLWYRTTIFRIEEKGVTHQLHLIGKIMNIQQEMETKMDIQDKADRDVLTGLYNRAGFEKNFNQYFKEGKFRRGMTFAILDIDNFKGVNDILGHDGGDEALKQLSNELKIIKCSNIIVGRYGGDEFLVCVFDISLKDAEAIFQRLVQCMDRTIQYQTEQKHISISLGAVYTSQQLEYSDLFVSADKVLYSVKSFGKNGFKIVNLDEKE